MDDALDIALHIAEQFEGLRLEAYHDPVGYPTQGYGRLLSRQRYAPLDGYPPIDNATARAWLADDMLSAQRSVHRLVPVPLSAGQEAALIDFSFNCGAGNLQVSTLRHAILRGDFDFAASQFKRWVWAGGVKLPGLVRRRGVEEQIFVTG